jgi:hypothetical protein
VQVAPLESCTSTGVVIAPDRTGHGPKLCDGDPMDGDHRAESDVNAKAGGHATTSATGGAGISSEFARRRCLLPRPRNQR